MSDTTRTPGVCSQPTVSAESTVCSQPVDAVLAEAEGSGDSESETTNGAWSVAKNARLRKPKRGRSVGNDPTSPESLKAIEESKKKVKQLATTKTCNTVSGKNVVCATAKPKKLVDPCVYCNTVGTITNMIECDLCEQSYHLECCGVTSDKHASTIDVISLLGWSCAACRHDYKVRVNLMYDELTAVKAQVAVLLELHQKQTPELNSADFPPLMSSAGASQNSAAPPMTSQPMTSQPMKYADMVKEVGRTVRDVNRRKKNVIISGLNETTTSDKDAECLIDIAYEILHLDLTTHLVSCKRIGKAMPARPRRLLVVLSSETAAEDLLHRAHMLRDCGSEYLSKNVYINRDLTPEEAAEAFMRRKERREARTESTREGKNGAAPEPTQHSRPGRAKVFYRTQSTGHGSGIPAQNPNLMTSNTLHAASADTANINNDNLPQGGTATSAADAGLTEDSAVPPSDGRPMQH